ncbi:MAG: hypothetical protein NDJ89_02975 [Oligoflexia bacterium]|nr:hypothetical protein [Oligoflexia bacterium]
MIERLLNRSGFTLVEVLIAGAIATMTGLALLELVKSNMKSQSFMMQYMSVQDMMNAASLAMSSRPACKQSLLGTPVPTSATAPSTVTGGAIRGAQAPFDPIISVGSLFPINSNKNNGVEVQSIQLFSSGPNVVLAPKSSLVRINYRRWTGLTTSLENFRELNLIVFPNAAGTVEDCYSSIEAYTQAACLALGGTYNSVAGQCTDLQIPSSNRFCINGQCWTAGGSPNLFFGTQTCPIGTKVTGLSPRGNIICGP